MGKVIRVVVSDGNGCNGCCFNIDNLPCRQSPSDPLKCFPPPAEGEFIFAKKYPASRTLKIGEANG